MVDKYEVLERVGLPVMEERVVHVMSDGTEIRDLVATGDTVIKERGSEITGQEFKEAAQRPDQVKSLIESGAIKEYK
jgi:hypothetical protein